MKVGVVGAGQMGGNHCRVYSTLRGADLVAVVDTDRDRALSIASAYGCAAFASPHDLVGRVDAVSIAVPSRHHAKVGAPLLNNGVHCLVEKPLATTEADCQSLIDAAARSGATLLVGHIERFNPAVIQLKAILNDERQKVLAIDARRMSAVSARVTDIDVVLDLMVHDLDIVLDIMGEAPVDVTARSVTHSDAVGGDYVTALLSFPSGALATLTASRITQKQVRSLAVTTDQRFFTVDYSAQELLIYRQGRIGGVLGSDGLDGRYVLDVGTERVYLRRAEPLGAELAHFLGCVRGEGAPLVSGEDARRALRAVWDIQGQMGGSHG